MRNKLKYPVLIYLIFIFALSGCAEKPDGVIVMNEETIENFFEGDRKGLQSYNPPLALNLLTDQPVMKAALPPVPDSCIRFTGTLDSNGPYLTTAPAKASYNGARDRGSTFHASVFGKIGDAANGGTAWFWVDVNKTTGSVVAARAYLYGFMGGVCDMRDPAPNGLGQITDNGFTFTIDGPCLFPSEPGSVAQYALLIKGSGNPLASPDTSFDLEYIIDDTGSFSSIPQDPKNIWSIFDYGTGVLKAVN